MFRSITFALSLAMLGPAMSTAEAAAPLVGTQAPGYYRIMLGADEITVLSDGTAPREVDKLMSKPEEIRMAMAADQQKRTAATYVSERRLVT